MNLTAAEKPSYRLDDVIKMGLEKQDVILCIKMFLNRGHCVALKEMVYACH
jgi:hypothetical protein